MRLIFVSNVDLVLACSWQIPPDVLAFAFSTTSVGASMHFFCWQTDPLAVLLLVCAHSSCWGVRSALAGQMHGKGRKAALRAATLLIAVNMSVAAIAGLHAPQIALL